MRYQPGETIDHYRIEEALGEGAYAEAYKARDVENGRSVLIKSPNPLLFGDPQIYNRFLRESEISRRLDHPGVQRGLDLRKDPHQPYLVLEFIEGDTLRRRFREAGDYVDVQRALDWGVQLARALAYLHGKGVTHRDLKPENILVTAKDDRLKIVDFGTAMLTGARRLTWQHLTDGVGTPDYMSPEQIQGERGDARSDIYAWGIIMYELLTGRVPFEGDNWLAVMAGHLQRTPEHIRRSRPEVSPALEAVVLKAMRRLPQNRYQTAEALVHDLDHLDEVDATTFDFWPEPPMGSFVTQTPLQLWRNIILIALGFFAVLVLVVVIARMVGR